MPLQDQVVQGSELGSMGVEEAQDVYVMSATPSQMRFWSLHHLLPENHALNMPLAWTCRGKLDSELVAGALAEIVRRHESLRTTFDVVDGKLSQIIKPPFAIPVPIEDLSALPGEERRQRTGDLIRKEAQIQMDLKKGPLFFARLVRLDLEEHVLMITIHHSVCDGWSNGVILRDFAAIYDGLVRHIQPDLPELAVQFGDFAIWLEEWRKSTESAKSLEYWRKTLGEGLTPLRIRRDLPGGAAEKHGEIETILLAPELVQQARDFCASKEVTLYMLLFASYAITLARLTGQNDFLIGTPCANRRAETEDLIGSFSNPQVIRIKIKEEDSLDMVLDQVRNWTLGAVAHQDLPFEDLYEDEFFSRQRAQIPLQVYFIFQKAFMQLQKTPSLEISPLRSVSPGTMFDLMLSIVERIEGPRLQLEYNSGFFHASTIQQILTCYIQTLEGLLSDTGSRVKDASVIQFLNPGIAMSGNLPSRPEKLTGQANLLKLDNPLPTPPRDELEAQLVAIWEDTFHIRGIDIHSNFFQMGGYSMMVVRLFSRMNKALGTALPITTIFDAPTIAQLAEIVRGHNTYTSLVTIQPKGTRLPFFLIHSYLLYDGLRAVMGEDQPFYGLRELDREGDMTVEQRAFHYVEEIRRIQPHGPYQLGGWCAAGPLAVETARQLTLIGEEVRVVVLFDSWRPGYSSEIAKQQPKSSFMRLISRLKQEQTERMAGAPPRAKARYIWARLRNKSTQMLNRFYSRNRALVEQVFEKLGLALPDFMHNVSLKTFNALRSYQGQPFPGRILLIRATDTPQIEGGDLACGWNALAMSGTDVVWAPGDHESMFRGANVKVVGGLLRSYLV